MLLPIVMAAATLHPIAAYNELSGEETIALQTAFRTLPSRALRNLSKSTVWISNGTGTIAVDFESAKGSVHVTIDNYDRARMMAVQEGPTLALPGTDAKAIAVASEAWLSKTVYCGANAYCKSGLPDPAAVWSGAFTVREYFGAKSGAGNRPAYVVSYLPSGAKWDSTTAQGCPSYATYAVDVSTFRVYLQPKAC